MDLNDWKNLNLQPSNNYKNISLGNQILKYTRNANKLNLVRIQNKRIASLSQFFSDSAVIQLNQLENNKILQNDKIIIGYCFREWQNFILLKDYLMNDITQFTFGSYLRSRKDLVHNDNNNQKDLLILEKDKFKNFLSFIVSDKLSFLIKLNVEKLEEVDLIWKTIRNDQIIDLKISQCTYKTEIIKILKLLEQYYLNLQHTLKIYWLNLKTNQQPKEMSEQNFRDYELFRHKLKLLKLTLEQFTDKIKCRIIQQQNDLDQNFENRAEDGILLLQQIEVIQSEVLDFNINCEKLQFLNQQLFKLHSFPFSQGNKFIFQTEKIIKLIEPFYQEIQQSEIIQFQEFHIAIYFENMLNRLFCFSQQMNIEIQNDLQNSLSGIREILIKYQEIDQELVTEELMQNKQQFKKFIQDLRFNLLQQQLNLNTFKEYFQKLLASAQSDNLQELFQIMNFNEFLQEAIKKYPNGCDIYKSNIFIEMKTLNVTENQQTKDSLSKYKGILQQQIFQFSLVEQEVDQEILDLELIKKKFGEIFIEKSNSFQQIDNINKILKNLPIERSIQNVSDKNFNSDQMKFEKLIYESLLKKFKTIERFQQITEIKQLYFQIEIVVETFSNSDQYHLSVSRSFIRQVLIELQNQIQQYEKYTEKKITEISSDQESQINPYVKNLELLIKVNRIQKAKVLKQRKILEKILEDIKQLHDSLNIYLKQSKEDYNKMFENFKIKFQNLIKIFENLQKTKIVHEQMTQENFYIDFERILIYLQIETDESEQKESSNIKMKFTNASDYFYKLKSIIIEQLIRTNYEHDQNQLQYEFIINQIKKLYFGNEKETSDNYEAEENQFEQLGFFPNDLKIYEDFRNNDDWKIKQGLIFTIIQISSNSFSNPIISFCQQILVQFWGKEKDLRVRNLLKNQTLLSFQVEIFQRDWKTQNNRIESEMKQMLEQIDYMLEQNSNDINLNEREKKLLESDDTTQKLHEYISNISEMSQQLNLSADFQTIQEQIQTGLRKKQMR